MKMVDAPGDIKLNLSITKWKIITFMDFSAIE
jgi:hypothetical protein